MASLFRYRFRGLSDGTYPVSLSTNATELNMPNFIGDVLASGEVRVSEALYFHLRLHGTGAFECDRCGRDFEREIEAELDVSFVPPSLESGHDDDVFVHHYDPIGTADVDLTEDIRDTLLLAVPMKNICGDDCPGFLQQEFEPEETENKTRLRGLLEKLKGEE